MPDSNKANIQTDIWSPITTQRLLLREFDISDTQGYYALESNEDNARYQDWPPRTLDQSRDLVLTKIQSSTASPRSVWELVVEKDGSMMGRVGAALSHHEGSVHFNMWFSFLPSVQGKGYATEAMEAFIEELIRSRDGGDVEFEIECDPRNVGSWKLAERLGFEKHGLVERAYESKGEWVDSLVYRKIVT